MIESSPVVFVHYSWDTEEHKNWVKNLVDKLISDGIDVFFDRYDLNLGSNSNYFMEKIEKADKVILITTTKYKLKADEREGGLGYEYQIINSEISRNLKENNKFITILREGNKINSIPTLLQPYIYLDMKDDIMSEDKYIELLKNLYDKPLLIKPQKGKKPAFLTENSSDPIESIFQLGKTREEVHKILGEPDEDYGIVEKYWTHGLEIYYNKHENFVDGVLVIRQENGIHYEKEIHGIKIGETFAEVKVKIGKTINWGLPNFYTSFAFYQEGDQFLNLAIWRNNPPTKYNDFKIGTIYSIGYCEPFSIVACEPIVALTIQQIKNNKPISFLEREKDDYEFNFNADFVHEEYFLTPLQQHFGGGYMLSAIFPNSNKIIDFWLYDLNWNQLVIRWISERDREI